MFKGVGNFVVKYRIWIIAVWVILAAVMLIFAPSLKEVGKLDNSAFLPEDTESGQGRELIRQYFPDSAVSSISLVFYDAEGLSEGDLTAARDIWAWLNSSEGSALSVNKTNSIFDNPQLEATLISPDNTTMILSVGTSGAIDNNEVVEALRDHLKSVPTDMQVYVSGEGGIIADLQDAILQSLDRTTLITILLVIVLLLIIYRSPVASLVPLITIGAAYLVSRGALGFIAQAGVSVWSQLDALVIVLVFGVGTDYCLFMVSRFREELKVQDSRVAAMRHTISKIGIVITASAFTVIIGLCGMAIARFEMLKTMGPLMGLTVFITLLAALTLAPAMASIMGKYLYWPTHEQVVQPGRGKAGKTRVPFFQRISHLATGKPVRVIIVVLVILAIPCVFYPQFNRSFDQTEEVPTKYESIKGYNVLEDHYDIGEMEPVDTVLASPAGIDLTSPQYLTALKDTVNDLSRVDGVLNIKSIINPQGGSEPLPALTVSGQLATLAESLNSSGQDIGSLFSPSTTQGFQLLNAYMLELGDNFSWVQDDTSYQRVLADLDNLQVELEQIKTQAGVGNQLQTLVTRLSQTGSSEFVPEAAGQYLQIIKGYLTELGQQYPDLQSSVDYQSALKICTDGLTMLSQMSTLPAAQQAVLAAQLQTGWQQLIGSLTALQQAFQGQETYLLSQTLAAAAGTDNTAIAAAFQTQLEDLKSQLETLGSEFTARDNPVYLSPVLLNTSEELESVVNMFMSDNRQATRMYIVLDSFPASDRALNTIDNLRTTLQDSISGSVLAGCEIGDNGTSATYSDIKHIIDSDFNHIMILVVVCTFLILIFLLRSLIAPLYLLAAVILSYFAAMGCSTLIFQNMLGQSGINFVIPIVTFVLLIALGSDYNIFLMSRIREESEKRGTSEGVKTAAIATGFIILACGIILAGTFAALASSPIRFMLQLGVTVAIGVIIDTAIMQLFLIPAVASRLGKWNWWPFKPK